GVYEGFGIPAKGPLAPSIFGYNDDAKPLEYNVEEAKKLLKEAGLEDGFKTTIWTNDSPQRIDTAIRSEEHTSELQSRFDLVCRLSYVYTLSLHDALPIWCIRRIRYSS